MFLLMLNPTSGIIIRIGFHMLSYFHTGQPVGGSRLLPSGLLLLRQVPKTVDREISQAGAGLKRAQKGSKGLEIRLKLPRPWLEHDSLAVNSIENMIKYGKSTVYFLIPIDSLSFFIAMLTFTFTPGLFEIQYSLIETMVYPQIETLFWSWTHTMSCFRCT